MRDEEVVRSRLADLYLDLVVDHGSGILLTLAYGAIISGSSAGVASCLFSDSMFMASACTGIPNDRELKVNVPYVGISAAIALALFLVVAKMVC